MKVLKMNGCCHEQINNVTEYMINHNIECNLAKNEPNTFLLNDNDASMIENDDEFEYYDFSIDDITFDVIFALGEKTCRNGWEATFEECQSYISTINYTDNDTLMDFDGGVIRVVCNETNATHYETEAKFKEETYYYASYQIKDGKCEGLLIKANNISQIICSNVKELEHHERFDNYNEAFYYIILNCEIDYRDIKKLNFSNDGE